MPPLHALLQAVAAPAEPPNWLPEVFPDIILAVALCLLIRWAVPRWQRYRQARRAARAARNAETGRELAAHHYPDARHVPNARPRALPLLRDRL
jgi:hypothetical protein